jgi:hypothetical protein
MANALAFHLHDAQLSIFNDPARFKVVAAGRRFGKSYLACVALIIEALREESESGKDLSQKEVYYIAPTFEQAKKIMWNLLKSMARMEPEGGLIRQAHENTAVATFVNGRRISIKGADRPDSLRGVGLSFCVMDEYAFMKPDVWELIIAPALTDVEGGALFIGTPEGKNHFYEIYQKALTNNHGKGGYEDWKSWTFESLSNPTLSKKEIANRIANMSVSAARQEYGASFNSGGGVHLREEWWKFGSRPTSDGQYYIAVDLAGFADAGSLKRGQLKIKDEHAITIARCGESGWFVEEIISGQWDVRETALQIVKAYSDYRPVKLGIEKGALKNAVGPYLEDEMKRLSRFFLVYDLSHGGQHKEDRIRWALQGRLEKGRLLLNSEESTARWSVGWQRKLIEQANDFPSPIAHDDLIDSLAYIDQLADTCYGELGEQDTLEVFDLQVGF